MAMMAARDVTDDQDISGQARLHNLFSLPNGDPALFHLHNFQNEQLTNNVIVSSAVVTLSFPVPIPFTGKRWSNHRRRGRCGCSPYHKSR